MALEHSRPPTESPAAHNFAQHFHENLSTAKHALAKAQQRQQRYENQHCRHVKFSVGDHVDLYPHNLNMQIREDSPPKLLPRYVGPFPITKVISHVTYELQLLPTMKCHNVFHISLLNPANAFNEEFPVRIQPDPPPVLVQDNQAKFMVEKNLKHHHPSARSHNQTNKYTIKWAGWPMHEATDEPAKNSMKDVPQEVDAYWEHLLDSL